MRYLMKKTMKKRNTEILKLRNMIIQSKNSTESFNYRLDHAEERISEPGDI